MTDVMSRLLAVEPLPRGERLARFYVTRMRQPWGRWRGLLCDSPVLWAVDGYVTDLAMDMGWIWRAYAAPLRRCREERKAALARIRELERALVLPPPERFIPTLFSGEFELDDEDEE